MKNSIKRKALLLSFAAMVSVAAFGQAGMAITLNEQYNPPVADSSEFFANNGSSDYNPINVDTTGPLYIQNLTPGAQQVSFAEFDVTTSGLQNSTDLTASLQLYGFGKGTVDAYYVANNAWVTNPTIGATPTLNSLLGTGTLLGSFTLDGQDSGPAAAQRTARPATTPPPG